MSSSFGRIGRNGKLIGSAVTDVFRQLTNVVAVLDDVRAEKLAAVLIRWRIAYSEIIDLMMMPTPIK